MARRITLDYSFSLDFIHQHEIDDYQEKISELHNNIHSCSSKEDNLLGWLNLPYYYDQIEFERINKTAESIKRKCDVFLVVGAGGSYLGSRAGIEMLNLSYYNELPKEKRNGPKVYYVGHNVSTSYIKRIINLIEGQDICLNIISKSGTTTEPMLAFRIFKDYLERTYGVKEANKRIIVTTDKSKGALREIANCEGYESFDIPNNIGGRYSVLTAVGLLPIAVAGIDINSIMQGAGDAYQDLNTSSISDNICYQYAIIRNLLYNKGKLIEILVDYDLNLFYFSEWYKQLFGESEGKNGKGIFPSSLSFTTDLHSMGQYIQDGNRIMFNTILNIENVISDMVVNYNDDNIDGLNYLSGKTLSYINKKAFQGALTAHVKAGVPNIILNIPELSPYYFGYLVYFFEKACAISAYLMGVNPFNQPGVEAYKNNMFMLLGKPGYKDYYDEVAATNNIKEDHAHIEE